MRDKILDLRDTSSKFFQSARSVNKRGENDFQLASHEHARVLEQGRGAPVVEEMDHMIISPDSPGGGVLWHVRIYYPNGFCLFTKTSDLETGVGEPLSAEDTIRFINELLNGNMGIDDGQARALARHRSQLLAQAN